MFRGQPGNPLDPADEGVFCVKVCQIHLHKNHPHKNQHQNWSHENHAYNDYRHAMIKVTIELTFPLKVNPGSRASIESGIEVHLTTTKKLLEMILQ